MENLDKPFGAQQKLPNATAVLVLGIVSIPTCCCYGVIGLVLGIIALALAAKDRKMYFANTAAWDAKSYANLNAGRICAIIGIILSALYLIYVIAIFAIFGWAALSDPAEMQERMRELFEQ